MTRFAATRDDQGGVRPPWSSFLLALVMALIYVVRGPMAGGLVFDRAAIAGGEVWRFATGHLVHADPVHLVANVGALFVLGTILESVLRLRAPVLWTIVGLAMVLIDLALWFWVPTLDRYCGFSGVLNAFFIVAVYRLWRDSGDSLLRLIAICGLGKIALETWGGAALFPLSSLPPVTEAHFAGFVAGLLLCIAGNISASMKQSRPVDWRHETVPRPDAAHP